MRVVLCIVLLLLAAPDPLEAQGVPPPRDLPAAAVEKVLRITSPLGRTGIVATVRIVVQIDLPPDAGPGPVEFLVDGERVGLVTDGPPYSVDWLDDNPFERREITVRTRDRAGTELSDAVVLPPFEVSEKTGITGVLLETTVHDASGAVVSNLQPDAFVVTEDGVQQSIDLVTRETVQTEVVLLVDNSQSMSRRMDFVRRATERLMMALRPGDRTIVAPFNAHLGTLTGPTEDRPTIAQAIAGMRAGGGTAVFDSLIEAAELLRAAEGRRVIVLITDGYDENSGARVDDVLRTLGEVQATVYVVAIGGVAGISLRGGDALRRVADRTGGRIYFPPRDIEMVRVADRIAADAHSRYLITYTPTNQKRDGTWRQVAVNAPQGWTARTREGYVAPEPPPIRPVIEFSVRDQAGYVDVIADDLDVYEDGVPQVVDTFQEAIEPVAIVMALDSSGSMRRSTELVKETASDFVRAVRREDSLALITFADTPRFAHVLATNRDWTLDAIEKYTAAGGTALYDALWNSLLHLRQAKGRRAVVVLTDGRDENNPGTAPGSAHLLDQVLELQRQVGATTYGVGLGLNVDRPVLERLAAQSGGQAYFASDASTLGDQLRRVVEDLRRRYVLSYSSGNRRADGAWRTVEIRPRLPGRVVVSPGGYFAPSE